MIIATSGEISLHFTHSNLYIITLYYRERPKHFLKTIEYKDIQNMISIQIMKYLNTLKDNHLDGCIPQDLLINLAQILIIKALPCLNPLHSHPCLIALPKFCQYDSRSPWQASPSIAVVPKASTITKPYSLQIPQKSLV